MRVAMLASECEPWAKTGGLADVVDALARALGAVDGAARSRRRSTSSCRATAASRTRAGSVERTSVAARPGPAVAVGQQRGARSSTSRPTATGCGWSTIRPAFDREGFYGDAAGDYADNAWRFGLFCRAALEALRADGRPVDVLHLHDWHTGPAAIYRDDRYADDPIVGRRGDPRSPCTTSPITAGRRATGSASSGCARATGSSRPDADGIDLLLAGIERAELVNTVSPGFAAEALTPEFGMGLDGALRAQGRPVHRHPQRARHDRLGSGDRRRPGRAVLARPTAPARRPAGPTC